MGRGTRRPASGVSEILPRRPGRKGRAAAPLGRRRRVAAVSRPGGKAPHAAQGGQAELRFKRGGRDRLSRGGVGGGGGFREGEKQMGRAKAKIPQRPLGPQRG